MQSIWTIGGSPSSPSSSNRRSMRQSPNYEQPRSTLRLSAGCAPLSRKRPWKHLWIGHGSSGLRSSEGRWLLRRQLLLHRGSLRRRESRSLLIKRSVKRMQMNQKSHIMMHFTAYGTNQRRNRQNIILTSQKMLQLILVTKATNSKMAIQAVLPKVVQGQD